MEFPWDKHDANKKQNKTKSISSEKKLELMNEMKQIQDSLNHPK
jgi:hypothetical protein